MSRQRLRPSLLEINYKECVICEGTGLVRSIESQSLQIIRSLEQLLKNLEKKNIILEISPDMAQYMLNNKYTVFDNKENNTIKLLINNEFNPNKFNISTESFNSHYETNSLEDKEKASHKKEVYKKVSKKKYLKKVPSKENKLLKESNKNKVVKTIKKKEIPEKKPLNKKVKAIRKKAPSKQKKVTIKAEKLEPKDIKTGWWDQ